MSGELGTTARVEYAPAVPPEVVAIVTPLLARWHGLIPTWVHRLRLAWDDSADDVANIRVAPEYRDATLTVGPAFLTRADWMREDAIIHELSHLLTAQMANMCRDVLVRFIPDESVREWADGELVKAIEGANCDTVRAIRAVARVGA